MENNEVLSKSFGTLAQGLEAITPWFQSNVESITDPVKFLDFQKQWDKKSFELIHLLVKEFEALKGKTPGASMLWLPQPTSGI